MFLRMYREGEHAQDVCHDSFIIFPPTQQTVIIFSFQAVVKRNIQPNIIQTKRNKFFIIEYMENK